MKLRHEVTIETLRQRATIGLQVVLLQEKSLLMRLPLRPDVLSPNGYLHAATVIALADTCCGFACAAHLPEGSINAAAPARLVRRPSVLPQQPRASMLGADTGGRYARADGRRAAPRLMAENGFHLGPALHARVIDRLSDHCAREVLSRLRSHKEARP